MSRRTNGCTIDGKHSFHDYGMILESKIISAPEIRTNYVDIPARNGLIDLSEAITGDVRYRDRKIVMNFKKAGDYADWNIFRSQLQNDLHGKKVRIIFDDDLAFYWLGRCAVEVEGLGQIATITITAEVEPYKYNITTSAEDWLWDPFDFEQSVINEFSNIPVNGTANVDVIVTGKTTNVIIIASASGMSVDFDGNNYPLNVGSQVVYGILMEAGTNRLTFHGNGNVTINYVGGSL